ncbi:hypothetical protein TNCV_4010231 [Trichonephila clavipes]|nr:hypothetical protein TNCV_4010231 [Trichonephila clavipes]
MVSFLIMARNPWVSECLLTPHCKTTREVLATVLVILSCSQVMRTTGDLNLLFKFPHPSDWRILCLDNVHHFLYTAGLQWQYGSNPRHAGYKFLTSTNRPTDRGILAK